MLCTALLVGCLGAVWPEHAAAGGQSTPDNTGTNSQQRANSAPTADQQKENASDRAITQQIRKAIVKDKSLSTYAHNIKVITQNGQVTLAGPVRSDEEKKSVEATAAGIAGADKVTSQLQIAPKL
jgi:hyperosmotically inducible periplasmic protein